jgi:hypothetical protein
MSTFKQILIGLGKPVLCVVLYFLGFMLGSMIAVFLKLPQPPMPAGVSQASAAMSMLLVSPILVLVLAWVDQGLAGNWLTRAIILTCLTYISYTLNTELDASLYVSSSASTSAFTYISRILPSLFAGGAAAWLFPPKENGRSFVTSWKAFFGQRTPGDWLWRLALSGIAFLPIYLFFGRLVYPFTGKYYQQSMFGLQAATWGQILPIEFVRSLLFLIACLPMIIAWKKSNRLLFLSLGMAMFVLVGLLYMLIGSWLPLFVRIPHSIEILADSFTYAGVLTLLLIKPDLLRKAKRPALQASTEVGESLYSRLFRFFRP